MMPKQYENIFLFKRAKNENNIIWNFAKHTI